MKRLTGLALTLALVAAACGGDDAADTTTTTAAPTTTTTTAPATTTTTVPPTTTTSSTTFPVNPNIGTSDTVTTGGLGAIRIGMNPQEANIAAGFGLTVDFFVDDTCYYLLPEPVLENVGFMVSNDTIARVDIFPGSNITTRSGARIGMTEAQIIDLFGDKIETSPHPYVTGGKYLTFVPVDEIDKNFRVIFETNEAGVVTSYRSGRLPEVGWIEGCL
ncbi:MAG: hypothetical protein HKN74_08945 [Acidimicrobiia bacterium]|nr:hypothetical protein [Acidimicrobiia bacterium]NNF10395.1 hypothetical protein [Acidimicrobiia bacterium]NNL71600.1 hypothetical protein [Acidimicrobiia bacterium]